MKNLKFKKPFIIAEIGGNHEGDFNYAKKLLIDAATSGADAAKFQTYYPDKIVSKVENKERNEHFSNFTLTIEQFKELAQLAKDNDIHFMSSIWDMDSFIELDPYILIHKIGSGDLTNYRLIKKIIETGKPLIFSIAMANMNEINATLEFINDYAPTYIEEQKLAILQCVAMYGNPKDEYANLNVITTLKKEFPEIIIGYSDHTEGAYAANIAVALGAKIIEVHFTDDKTRSFRDHHLSVTKEEINILRRNINKTIALLGSREKSPINEIETKKRIWEFRRACYLKIDCKKGDVISENNLTTLRPCQGIEANEYFSVIGKKLKVDKLAFKSIDWDDLES